MLSKEENELLCRVGPGTPMGELMRQYWIPALASSDLPAADGPPIRLRLLGENLIAFRDTGGRVGLLHHACAHRGASLFFGRNEEGGIRCVYHGWKYDVDGHCVDMPNEPAESNFKNKIRAVAYPCVERNGLIWTYAGPRATPPPLPDLEANLVVGPCAMEKVHRECNWLQALEGDIDTSHFGFLHRSLAAQPAPASFDSYMENDRAPRYAVVDTEFGASYGAYRPAAADTHYWRIAHFLFPFYAMIPTGVLGAEVRFRAWLPLDDENTMFLIVTAPRASDVGEPIAGGIGPDRSRSGQAYLPDTSDWLGRYRVAANARNDYKIDREAQRARSFTGIETGIAILQDQAITESMGPMYDRASEHLGSSDAMIIRTRQRLMGAALALRDEGVTPPGVDNPEFYRQRSGGIVLPRSADWLEATKEPRNAYGYSATAPRG